MIDIDAQEFEQAPGVWASSRSWWWTGKPGMLQSMGLQRVRCNWATELNWAEVHIDRHIQTDSYVHIFIHAHTYKRTEACVIPNCRWPHQIQKDNQAVFFFLITGEKSWKLFLSNHVNGFSPSVVSSSLQPHGLQHARPPCPSPTPRACSDSCSSSQ